MNGLTARSGLIAFFVGLFSLLGPGIAIGGIYEEIAPLLKSRSYQPALNKLTRHLKSRPHDPEARFQLGIVQTEMRRYDDAIRTFRELSEDHPKLPEPYNNLAVLLANREKYNEARAALLKAIETHPSYATAHENLGDIYAQMASQAYGKALQINSSNKTAKTKLALVKRLFTNRPGSGRAVAHIPAPTKPAIDPAATRAAALAQKRQQARQEEMLRRQQIAEEEARLARERMARESAQAASKPKQQAPRVPAPKIPNNEEALRQLAAKRDADLRRQEENERRLAQKQADQTALKQKVEEAVRAWASNWSKQNVDGYLSFYHREFKPARGGSRSAWAKKRRRLVSKPRSISVQLSSLSIELLGAASARAVFKQSYRSDSYRDRVTKTLTLRLTGQGWKILREESEG
ncbi:MAG: tetratricopeptide repeat protein [Magnetococcales bacterium]|nr:tetratricopeptide repeat protein [Magnetococcales bacterium]